MSEDNLPSVPQRSNEELSFLQQQDAHQFEYAKCQLDANLQNQREIREHIQELNSKNTKTILILCLSLMACFFGFGFFALWLGKEAFLADMMKVVIGALGGGGLGFYFGAKNKLPPTT